MLSLQMGKQRLILAKLRVSQLARGGVNMGRAVVPGRREGVVRDSDSGWAYVFRPKGHSLSLNASKEKLLCLRWV